ncbi:TusE/DsrC/DsvC family sulfur relay protein [Tropicimonas sp. IMCC6043]|uniref:TusE/DsrC/DsvC family sulfur relay protein n=1 Tax=Tropicimonas sp. IMCC6043 TaxID=2510645 RepID=UPI00101D3D49|nr:TusE/DsrC/DsvC family sulfur relay protein [Tropicimonas sp. IMCC6043]RYH06441.1 TusE/DsrC/DsvC family sulfur relay protein [Tropicimonas sp. IMCC6043]
MRTRPDAVTTITLPSGPVRVDEAGYLTDPEQWTRDFAMLVAEQEEIALRELHWQVIAFMRSHLDEHGIAADARIVLKFLGEKLGVNKASAKQALFELFPYGYVQQACKMAGMRQPRAWSTG